MIKKGVTVFLVLAMLVAYPAIGLAEVTIGQETADFSAASLPAGWSQEGGVSVSDGVLQLSGSGNCAATFSLPIQLPFGADAPDGQAEFGMNYATGQTGDWTTGCKDKEVHFLDASGAAILSFRYNPDGWLRCYWAGGTDVDVRNLSYASIMAQPNEVYAWRVAFDLKHSTFSMQIKGPEDAEFYTPYYYDAATGEQTPYRAIPLANASGIASVKIWFYGNGEGYTNSVTVSDFTYPVLRTEDTQPPYWESGAALRADVVTAGAVTLGWDAALDDTGVANYRIYQDGVYSGQTTTQSYTVSGLQPNSTYTFSVEAADASANVSADRLEVTVQTEAGKQYLSGIEDFETTAAGEKPESWIEGQTVVEEPDGNHAMKVGYGGTAKFKLPSKVADGTVSLYADLKIDDPADVKWMTVYDSNGAQAAQLGVVPDDDGNMGLYCYYYNDGWQWGNFLQTQPNTTAAMAGVRLHEWNTVRMDIDLDAKTFSILYKDETGAFCPTYRMSMTDTFMATDPAVGTLSTVECNASMSTAGYLLDNFRYPMLQEDDKMPPVWASAAVTGGSVKGGDFVWIDWADAVCRDNVGVAGYQIYQDGQLVAEADGDATAAKVTGLAGETAYTFELCAVDGNQNRSSGNPTITLKTKAVSVREIAAPERLSAGGQPVTVTLENHASGSRQAMVIAAVYQGSRMRQMRTATQTIGAGATAELTVTAEIAAADTALKIFVIDGFSDMTILAEPMEILQ